ncbi:hypothetical protein DTO212C5_958 [Paecilomyces variotii]|nr:hypothetical protein DTO212C5_958 [Paecilomyces variotii]
MAASVVPSPMRLQACSHISQTAPGAATSMYLFGLPVNSPNGGLKATHINKDHAMQLDHLPTELLLHIFRRCETVSDVLNLASTSRHFRRVYQRSNKLLILVDAAEAEFGPLEDITQIVTQNASQPAHIFREAPMSDALLKQAIKIGRVAKKWEEIYPFKKWKIDYDSRRLLTDEERFRLRRAIYRLWLYHRAFHNRLYDRYSRNTRSVIAERAQLLHNWSTEELADIEDVRQVIWDVVQYHICPSNGTIQRKFHRRYPERQTQLTFNIHLNYPVDRDSYGAPRFGSERSANSVEQIFYNAHPPGSSSSSKFASKLRNDVFHDPGFEGWGDEIPHYYVIQDMLKLDPGQVLFLREHAPLKEQVEAYIFSQGEWFKDNGETFFDTLQWVLKERAEDLQNFSDMMADRQLGVARDIC